jgi:hypothetical protein
LVFPSLITNSLIVFLNTSYVFHVLVVFHTPSDWFNYQSLARELPVPAYIIIRRLIIPQAIAIPPKLANNYLLATTPYLIAGHRYNCILHKPTLNFTKGGKYTMSVNKRHHMIRMTPIDAHHPTPHAQILLHERHPYDPPTYHNNATTNRPNATTLTAFVYHLRYGCASEQVLRRTQSHVKGMNVQMDSWPQLKTHLPCDGCLAGKMRKTNKAQSSAFTPVYNLALSWTPQTTEKVVIPNKDIATDWGIINKQLLPGRNNVFALFLDLNRCISST